MAAYLSLLCFTILSNSLISLPQLVSGTQKAFVSVHTPVVYVVAGNTLTLDCTVNNTVLSASQVSWKHEGKWLHNQTQRSATKVRLVIRRITRQQHGLYQCSLSSLSGQSQNAVVAKDANVTVLVGGPISKPKCVSNGLIPPKTLLIWNTIENEQSDLQFTYNVLYCYKPSFRNKFCYRPPHGYSILINCSDLSINTSVTSSVKECNVTSLFKTLFPNLFDVHEQVSGRPAIFFIVNLGNVQSDNYSPSNYCNPLESVRCTKPENIRVTSIKKKTLSLEWDAPKDMGDFQKLLHYLILFAVDGADKNQTTDFVSGDFDRLVNFRHDFTSLHPYTLHHIYIACSITSSLGSFTRGEYIGPFSARTLEDEPSDHPRIVENLTSTVAHEEYRDVTLTWTLPNKETWNGIINRFVLRYWTVNSSMAESDTSRLEVFRNVSNTTGTLSNLYLNETYAVTVQMCTRVGCGPASQPSYIPETTIPVTARTHVPRKKKQVNFFLIFGIILAIVFCIVSAVVGAYLWTRKMRCCITSPVFLLLFARKRRLQNQMKPLSDVIGDVEPPHSYDSPDEPSKYEDSGHYDETFAPLLNDKTEYVKIRSSQSGPLTRRTSEHDEVDSTKL